jgi:hypothetical protein
MRKANRLPGPYFDECAEKILDAQERYVKKNFSEKAAAEANYGWFQRIDAGAVCIVTKVYGHGVLFSLYNGGDEICHAMMPGEEIASEATERSALEKWLQARRLAGLKIDPETAEVDWQYRQTLDPYGVWENLPPEAYQVGREYFARARGSDIWVWFGDLPDEVSKKLWAKHKSSLAFPAGHPGFRTSEPTESQDE